MQQSNNGAGTAEWLNASYNLNISLKEYNFHLAPFSYVTLGSTDLALNHSIRQSLLPFEEDWNAPGMELYDHL